MQYRERDTERRTHAGGTLDGDLPTVELDEALGKRKAQPGAFSLAAAVLAELLELLEKRGLILGCYPYACVLHREINGVRSLIDGKVYSAEAVRDSAEAVERDSAKAAHVASRHASLAKPKIQKGSAHVGATLAHLERQLRVGNTEYLTSEWADWLSTVHADGDYGDPNAGRAYRLVQDYEFPT